MIDNTIEMVFFIYYLCWEENDTNEQQQTRASKCQY